MLMYSVLIHVCIATTFLLVKMLNLPFTKTLPAITYTVDLVELQRPQPKKHAAVAKRKEKKEQPKPKPPPPPPKPEPKPEPKIESKPEPKPEAKKNVVPPPEKKVEVPKVAEKPKLEEKPPEVKVPPDPPKEETPPPEPEPEAPEMSRAVEPEPEPVAESTVDLDTEYITPELKWYIEIIRRKVWQNWIEPVHALAPGTYARVVIRFEIGRDGTFASEPVIYESSNIFLLDQSGFRAVLRSAPFPPLPESYTGTSLGVRFGFEYGERV
jgi:outer membrane biosynthesis protein TonB